MDKEQKKTLDDMIGAPEESELEKENPDKLDLEEPVRRVWLRVLLWIVAIIIIGGAAYTGFLVLKSNPKTDVSEKIEGKIDLDGNNTVETTPGYVYVNSTDGLNLRSTPSSTGVIIVVVPNKTKLEVMKLESGWYEVKYNTGTGYVWNEYVTKALPPTN